MAGTQSLNLQRSAPTFTADPAELLIALPKTDPLYDPRVEGIAITKEDVILFLTVGPPVIEVRRRGDDNIPIDGKQRTKSAIVVNALGAGVKYKGPVNSVKAAIKELSHDEHLVEFCTSKIGGKAVRLRCVDANAGNEAEARLKIKARNNFRHEDAIEETIAWARDQIEKFGTPLAEVALAIRKSEATVTKWLKNGAPKKASERKKRVASARPPSSALRKVLQAGSADLSPREATLLRMTLEGVKTPGFIEAFPILATTLSEAS